ncbi:MAG: tRNA uridine-5-carboxymethylaminomethyl(34) synthesis GTPase MnmE [Chlamydiota bacterium]
MQHSSTIVAPITPPGRGGVSGIRISGPEALDIADSLFSKDVRSIPSHRAVYGKIACPNTGSCIDQVLLLPMHGPHSYTGEDVVEIFCHGSPWITEQIVQKIIDCGAVLAQGGEFTLRAFQNGKMDLMQAEAVQKLIGAESSLAASSASEHLEGYLSKRVQTWQEELTEIGAIFLAAVDFPEEGLAFATRESLNKRLLTILQEMEALLASFQDGKKLEEHVSFCLAGPPNVGKSSLLNALLRKDRAIVTNQAGTTRDLLEESFSCGSHTFTLTDTAGIREGSCPIEQEGIKRSKEVAKKSDFVVFVLDTYYTKLEACKLLEEHPPAKTLLVWNKADLQRGEFLEEFPYQVAVSAKTGKNLDALRELFIKASWNNPPDTYPFLLTQKRHQECLKKAKNCLDQVREGLAVERSFEFLSIDLQDCLQALAQMVGTCVTEDLLSSIFSQFCVGK